MNLCVCCVVRGILKRVTTTLEELAVSWRLVSVELRGYMQIYVLEPQEFGEFDYERTILKELGAS